MDTKIHKSRESVETINTPTNIRLSDKGCKLIFLIKLTLCPERKYKGKNFKIMQKRVMVLVLCIISPYLRLKFQVETSYTCSCCFAPDKI